MLEGASAGGVGGGAGVLLPQMNRSRSAPETSSPDILKRRTVGREGDDPEAAGVCESTHTHRKVLLLL